MHEYVKNNKEIFGEKNIEYDVRIVEITVTLLNLHLFV